MDQIEVFQILGIEPTKDERAIKNAYREKLGVTNPEDNPEGFKRLRAAFEEACRLAKQTEAETEEEEKDMSPSGIWVSKASDIYQNINSRQDIEQWKELFQEDIFLSLEEEENCRLKLLRFLMEHYKLPTEVWKLLDKKLNITGDMARLRERFPAEYISFIASKCERGEDVVFEQFEGEPTAPYDLFLQYYEQCYRALDAEQLEQAQTLIANADGLHIFHPVLEVCRADLYEKQGNVEEAITLLQKLQERFPKDAMVCYNCAEMLWRHEKKEEAAAIYESLKEENESHYMSNVRLTQWYFEQKRYKDAKKCAEKVLFSGGDDDFMELLKQVNEEIEKELEAHYEKEKDWESGLELGWCYLQDGKVNKGIRLAEEIEKDIPQERDSEHKGLLTKLYIEETEFELAADMAAKWEQALQKRLDGDESEEEKEKDRDRIRQYHVIKMHYFRSQGERKNEFSKEECAKYYGYAIEEAEKLETGSSKDIGILLEKAQIYMDMEEYDKSLEVTQRLITDYQIYAAYATEMEVYRRQWDAAGVVQSARQCISYFPSYVRSYEHIAKVFLDLKRNEDLLNVLKDAEKNGVKSVLLDACRYQMDKEVPDTKVLDEKLSEFRKKYFGAVEKGDLAAYEEGLPILTEYLYWYPGSYMLVERALFHRVAHHYAEAIEDFEKALAEVPNQQYALYGLSFVYKYMGDYEKALIYIKRAIRYRDKEMSHLIFADMANLYSLLGDTERALKAYEMFADYDGHKNVYHQNRLAMCMARCGDVDKAIDTLQSAHKDYKLTFYDEAVNIYQVTGNQEKAQKLLDEWNHYMQNIQKTLSNENHADYHCRRAWQELMYGNGEQAMASFELELKHKEHSSRFAGALCDSAFAAILCGDDKRGRRYGALLRLYRNKEKSEGRNDYFNQEKGRLQLDFLADYYCMTGEELEKLLSGETNCEICHFCTYCICKELEGVRILLMLRMGRIEEAIERLSRNLEKQPLDEYMLAIRHMCADGVKVTLEKELLDYNAKPAEERAKDISSTPKAGAENGGFFAKLGKMFGHSQKD